MPKPLSLKERNAQADKFLAAANQAASSFKLNDVSRVLEGGYHLLVVGGVGTGKTITVAMELFRLRLKALKLGEDYKIYNPQVVHQDGSETTLLNADIFPDVIDLRELSTLITTATTPGALFIDEIASVFPAGRMSSEFNLTFAQELRQARKGGISVFATTTSPRMVPPEYKSLIKEQFIFLAPRKGRWEQGKNLCPAFGNYWDPKMRWEHKLGAKFSEEQRDNLIWQHTKMPGIRSCLRFPERFDAQLLHSKKDMITGMWETRKRSVKCLQRFYHLGNSYEKQASAQKLTNKAMQKEEAKLTFSAVVQESKRSLEARGLSITVQDIVDDIRVRHEMEVDPDKVNRLLNSLNKKV